MSALTDPVLRGMKDPTQDYLKDFVITGEGEEVEQKLKDVYSWNIETPVALVGIHIGDNGQIIQAKLIICGVKEVGRIALEKDKDKGKAGGKCSNLVNIVLLT